MKPKYSFWRRSLICAVAALLLAGGVPAALADSQSSLESKIAALEKEASAWASRIRSSRSAKEDAETQKAYLDQQIASVEKQIDLLDYEVTVLNRKIYKTDAEIAATETGIAEKEAAIREEYARVQLCVRNLAKRGIGTDLQFLMDTDSYADYLLKSKMMACVAESEEATLSSLETELKDIEDEKKQIEAEKAALKEDKKAIETTRATAEKKQAELDTLYDQSQRLVNSLSQSIASYQAKQRALESEVAKLEDEIKALQQKPTEQVYTPPSKTGKMYWPAPGVTIVTSRYGYRWGKLHKGTDISGHNAYGKNIVAAADGVVITATYHSSYGNYVIVDNGKDSSGHRIMTLYAHMSHISTHNGARVTGGSTVLGQLGSTGNSTGPHLHFEVRIDGVPVDSIAKGYIVVP